MFQADKKPILFNKELTGNPITFNSRLKNMPLSKCEITIPVSQQGSGTPSPDNIREFNTFSSVTIGDISDNQYKTFLSGVINGTYGFVDLGGLTWSYGSGSQVFYTEDITDMSEEIPFDNMVCPVFETLNSTTGLAKMTNYSIKRGNTESSKISIYVKDTDYTVASDFKTVVSGVYLIYELAEQTAPSYTLEQFNALCQAFGVTGISLSFVFGQTIYSGILDVKTGVLSVTHELKTIDENSIIGMSSTSTGIFAINNFFNLVNDNDSVDCDHYQRGINRSGTAGVLKQNPEGSFCCNATSRILYIKDTRFTSAEDYKSWLTNNNVHIAAKLATPIQIPLGGYLIEALKGKNNLISSVGTITAKIVEVK